MVCGRNEKFNVFDLACGFLNNSLKALAHILPTSGDYDLWQSMILQLCSGPAFPWHKWGSKCESNALCHFLVAFFHTEVSLTSAAKVRMLLIYSQLSQYQGFPCGPYCSRFISSRCNKLSQKLQIWWPWGGAIQLSLLFSCQSQDASHHPIEYLIYFLCGHCCSHFLPLHPLLLLLLQLSPLVKCQAFEYFIYKLRWWN